MPGVKRSRSQVSAKKDKKAPAGNSNVLAIGFDCLI